MNRLSLLLALILGFAATASADPIVVWPQPPLPPGQNVYTFPVAPVAWMDDFQEHLTKKAKAGRVDLIFDGDSITDRWEGTGLKVWQAHFGDHHPYDAGIGADGVEHALWRLDHGEVDGLDPKLIVIMIGTNNIQKYSSGQVAEGIKALVADYRKHFPQAHVLLMGIFPRAQLPTDPLREKIKQANQIISSLDDGKNVTYLDIGTKFLQPDGSIAADMMPDFLHPTEKGYEIWADAIQPIVDQYCPKSDVAVPSVSATICPKAVDAASSLTVTWPPPEPPPGTNPLVFPVPNLDWYVHWFGRFQNNVDRVKSNSYDLIFDGDDNMERLQYVGQDTWKARYGSIKAVDLAIGDRPQHCLWRIQHGEIAGQNPKLAVLLFGFDWPNEDPGRVGEGIQAIVHEYATHCPTTHILLLGVLPRETAAQSPTRDWITKINKILATCDDGKQITFLDIGPKFLQPDGTLPKEMMSDPRQLSAKGYAVLADAIQPVIDQYFPKPAAK